MDILVTNNPLVQAQYQNEFKVEFLEKNLLEVMIYVRDQIHKGHNLLTHPLSGSVKPNETLYKSVLISEAAGSIDLQSLRIIEECISATQKFTVKQINEKYLHDLQLIDFTLIKPALSKHVGERAESRY